MLNSTLDARKNRPGQEISARVMQNVLLPDGGRIPARSRVLGHILQVSRPTSTSGSRLVCKFDRILVRGHSVPLTAALRALASMMDVYEAQMPTNAWADYGTSVSDWNTIQVGGDAVYRGSGQVLADNRVVGSSTIGGDVTAKLAAMPD